MTIIEKFLRSPPTNFDAIVVATEDTKDHSQFLVDELHALKISHEHILNRETNSSLDHSFKTQVSFGQGRGRGRSNDRESGRSPHKGGRGDPSSSSVRGSNENPSQGPSQNQAQGCGNHMIGSIEMFSNLDESVKYEVTLGTDSKVYVMGKGRVNILTKKGEKKCIADVYFIPGLKHNLIIIGHLMQKGYNVFFKNDECTILDNSPRRH
eukprot:PITA_25679